MTAKEVIKKLKQDGWYSIGHTGGHQQFKHPVKRGKVTVGMHKGDISKINLHSIYKQAGWK
ncbi:MAG TPA: type II toxin-antitoxin system HicA family toxin [Bacteroidia bacterium]|nr:type II toxin-antitoxin system HicA family toxin [Bacteroidia bacterium]